MHKLSNNSIKLQVLKNYCLSNIEFLHIDLSLLIFISWYKFIINITFKSFYVKISHYLAYSWSLFLRPIIVWLALVLWNLSWRNLRLIWCVFLIWVRIHWRIYRLNCFPRITYVNVIIGSKLFRLISRIERPNLRWNEVIRSMIINSWFMIRIFVVYVSSKPWRFIIISRCHWWDIIITSSTHSAHPSHPSVTWSVVSKATRWFIHLFLKLSSELLLNIFKAFIILLFRMSRLFIKFMSCWIYLLNLNIIPLAHFDYIYIDFILCWGRTEHLFYLRIYVFLGLHWIVQSLYNSFELIQRRKS